KRRVRFPQFIEALPQIAEDFLSEAGANLARVDKAFPIIAVVADEQGAKAGARTAWLGEPANNEFLPADAFDFYPPGTSVVSVRTVALLADNPFAALCTGLLPVLFASLQSTFRPPNLLGAMTNQPCARLPGCGEVKSVKSAKSVDYSSMPYPGRVSYNDSS